MKPTVLSRSEHDVLFAGVSRPNTRVWRAAGTGSRTGRVVPCVWGRARTVVPRPCLLSSRRGAGDAMALEEAQDLHLLRQFDREFLVPFEMMNRCGIAARELAHGLNA